MDVEFVSADTPPDDGRSVLGWILYRYTNADWKWSGPYVYSYRTHPLYPDQKKWWGYDGGYQVSEPDVWCELPHPPLPECEERTRAIEYAKREAEIEAQIDALKATL